MLRACVQACVSACVRACMCVCALRKYTVIVLDVRLVNTFMASKVVNCSSNAAISSMESRRLGFYKSGADWRSG